jgi:hypothetical protein
MHTPFFLVHLLRISSGFCYFLAAYLFKREVTHRHEGKDGNDATKKGKERKAKITREFDKDK